MNQFVVRRAKNIWVCPRSLRINIDHTRVRQPFLRAASFPGKIFYVFST